MQGYSGTPLVKTRVLPLQHHFDISRVVKGVVNWYTVLSYFKEKLTILRCDVQAKFALPPS